MSIGHGPLYRRLADALRDAMAGGELGAGSRLPSERQLATALGMSRTTVINAYRVLRDEGLVAGQRGSGTHLVGAAATGPSVPATAFATGKTLDPLDPDVIDLSTSVILDDQPILGDLPITFPADLGASRYEPLGLSLLREQIAARYSSQGLPTAAGDILITTGAQQAINLVFTLFGRDGGPILVEAPTYAGALDAARVAGIPLISLPTGSAGPEADTLRTVLRRHQPTLLYLMTTVHNPTGVTLEPARRRAIFRVAADHGVPIVDDEALSDLIFEPRPRDEVCADILIGSLDKTCWPGLRIGWVRAREEIMAKLVRLKATADLGSSAPSQVVASLLVPRLDEITATRRRTLRERTDLTEQLLRDHLPDWTWKPPTGGMFLWVRLPYGDAETFAEAALRHGVRVLPGPRTIYERDFTDRIRVSLTAPPEVLRAGIHRLQAAWSRIEPTRPSARMMIELPV